jgi:hypothetical protein
LGLNKLEKNQKKKYKKIAVADLWLKRIDLKGFGI